MQISLVGAGYWGSKLQKELETIPNVDAVEIIDIKDGKTLKDIKYNNVILATPAWDHYKQTIELLEQGKNLYVEKPLALTKEECLDIKSKIKDNQTLMVGHIFLYNDRVKYLHANPHETNKVEDFRERDVRFSRLPIISNFLCGFLEFTLCTVHLPPYQKKVKTSQEITYKYDQIEVSFEIFHAWALFLINKKQEAIQITEHIDLAKLSIHEERTMSIYYYSLTSRLYTGDKRTSSIKYLELLTEQTKYHGLRTMLNLIN